MVSILRRVGAKIKDLVCFVNCSNKTIDLLQNNQITTTPTLTLNDIRNSDKEKEFSKPLALGCVKCIKSSGKTS